jgi:hypothetical protein
MKNSKPDDIAYPRSDTEAGRTHALADEADPILAAEGFSDERIDELADDFVTGRIGEGTAQFINWAIAQGPIGLDPEERF